MNAEPPGILIFGGTFDPPHLAHTTLPPLAAARLGCERILYIPAALNPLKSDHAPTPARHRLAMLEIALRDVPAAEISTVELDRARLHPHTPSYTIDTLGELSARLAPGTILRLLIGSDQALVFHQWKDWLEILTLATPAVILREPWTAATFQRKLIETYPGVEAATWIAWTLLEGLPRLDISATEIRRRLQSGAGLDGLLDPAVTAYIRAHRLFA